MEPVTRPSGVLRGLTRHSSSNSSRSSSVRSGMLASSKQPGSRTSVRAPSLGFRVLRTLLTLVVLVAERLKERGAVEGAIAGAIHYLYPALQLWVQRERGPVALAGNGKRLGVLFHVKEPDAGIEDVQDRGATRAGIAIAG